MSDEKTTFTLDAYTMQAIQAEAWDRGWHARDVDPDDRHNPYRRYRPEVTE